MGSPLRPFTTRKSIDLEDVNPGGTCTVAVDTPGFLYQFLTKIRDHETGEPLKDSQGRVTSHLVGLFNRTSNMIDAGIKPVYVLEGEYPDIKQEEIQKRREERQKAVAAQNIAEEIGFEEKVRELQDKVIKIDQDKVDNAKKLLEAMGIPVVDPDTEAEAQCARMAKEGMVDYAVSEDYDTLLFGAPIMLQNLKSNGCDRIDLEKSLQENDITHEQLLWIGILLGTDYNNSPHGVGKKTAMKIVQECEDFNDVVKRAKEYDKDIDVHRWVKTLNWLKTPDVDLNIEFEWHPPDRDRVVEVLVEKHDFNTNSVKNNLDTISEQTATRTFDEF